MSVVARFFGSQRWLGWLCTAAPLGSCGALSWEERGVSDEGIVCLSPGAPPFGESSVRLEANAPLFMTVHAAACLSSSCSRAARGSCNVTLRDQELIVSSEFTWQEKTRGGCTDDCNGLTASCESPPLPAGSYAVRHGREQRMIVVPSLRTGCLNAP